MPEVDARRVMPGVMLLLVMNTLSFIIEVLGKEPSMELSTRGKSFLLMELVSLTESFDIPLSQVRLRYQAAGGRLCVRGWQSAP